MLPDPGPGGLARRQGQSGSRDAQDHHCREQTTGSYWYPCSGPDQRCFHSEEGKGGSVEITGEVDESTVEAITKAVPTKERERRLQSSGTRSPPRPSKPLARTARCSRAAAGVMRASWSSWRAAPPPGFTWDLLAYPPDLSSLKFNVDSQTFEVVVDSKVSYTKIDDDVNTCRALPRTALKRTWSAGWTRRSAIRRSSSPCCGSGCAGPSAGCPKIGASRYRNCSMASSVLRRKLGEQLQIAKAEALKEGFQQALFGADADIVVSDEPGAMFTYPADMTQYPAHAYYQGGTYRFRKHYPSWAIFNGRPLGARWVRSSSAPRPSTSWMRWSSGFATVDKSQFWMPTSKQRTYPDFVARLKDGRLLVVEYKGGDRYSADSEKEKRMIGELWAAKSNGRGVYLMAQLRDEKGNSITEQLKAAISK